MSMLSQIRRFALTGLVIYAAGASAASAESVTDPQQWINRFDQMLQSSDITGMKKAIVSLPTRSGNGDGLASTADAIANFGAGKASEYASVLQTTRLGDRLSRFIVMAKYKDSKQKPFFILFDFMQSTDGWLLLEVAGNTNLNTLLAWPWDFN